MTIDILKGCSEIDSLKKNLYKVGMVSIILVCILIPVQIFLFLKWPHPTTILGWFELYHKNVVLGFIGFDILYMVTNVLMIFVLIAMFTALYNKNRTRTLLGLLLGIVGITIYFSSCKCVEMLSLSSQYFEAATSEQKNILLAAGTGFYATYKVA